MVASLVLSLLDEDIIMVQMGISNAILRVIGKLRRQSSGFQ